MAKKERSLTPAEAGRKERFDTFCREMESAGYQKSDLTIGVVFANIAAIFLMLPFAAAFWIWYFLVNASAAGAMTLGGSLVLIIFLLILTAVHEGIHGLTWSLFTKEHFRAISFGFIWQSLTPYCTCAGPLKRWQYLLGVAMPTLILGFGLGTVSVLLGQPLPLFLSLIMLLEGGGDGLILLRVLLYRPRGNTAVYCDHPNQCGAVVFEKASPSSSINHCR